MAVPKRKTSKSRIGKRRSHLALKITNIIEDKNSGEYRLPHQICKVTGTYNGRQIVKTTSQEDDEEKK